MPAALSPAPSSTAPDTGYGAPPPGGPPPLAHWHVRVGAALLDSLLFSVLLAQVYGLAVLGVGVGPLVGGLVLLVGVVALLALTVQQSLQLGRTGATFGKRLLGLRVVSLRDGQPLGLLNAFLRPLAHAADSVLSLGYLLPLVDGRKQTLADKMQKTVVLQVQREGRVGLLPLLAVAQVLVLAAGAVTGAVLLSDELREDTGAVAQQPSASTAPTAPAAPAAPAAPGAAALDPTDLLGRIVPPAGGNTPVDGSGGDLSLLEAAERLSGFEGQEAEAEAADLEARGLVAAAAQGFLTPDGAFYEVVVARYETPALARSGLDYLAQFNGDAEPSRSTPGARVYRFDEGEQSIALADLAVGSYLYEVSAGADTLEQGLELLEAVLAAQAAHANATT